MWDWSAGLAHVVDAADLFGSGVKCDSSPCESSSDSSNAQSAEPRLLRILRRHCLHWDIEHWDIDIGIVPALLTFDVAHSAISCAVLNHQLRPHRADRNFL